MMVLKRVFRTWLAVVGMGAALWVAPGIRELVLKAGVPKKRVVLMMAAPFLFGAAGVCIILLLMGLI